MEKSEKKVFPFVICNISVEAIIRITATLLSLGPHFRHVRSHSGWTNLKKLRLTDKLARAQYVLLILTVST